MARVKDAFMEQIDEQYVKVIAPQEDKLDIPSAEVDVDSNSEEDGMPF